jgi:hypothetical protein
VPHLKRRGSIGMAAIPIVHANNEPIFKSQQNEEAHRRRMSSCVIGIQHQQQVLQQQQQMNHKNGIMVK